MTEEMEIHSDRFHVKSHEWAHHIKVVDISRCFRLTCIRIGTVMLVDHIDRGYIRAPTSLEEVERVDFRLTMDIVPDGTRSVFLTVPCGWETTHRPDETLVIEGLSLQIQHIDFAGESRETACDIQILGIPTGEKASKS